MSAPEQFMPEVPEGWVRVAHPDLDGITAIIALPALPAHEARGWRRADDIPEPEPEPDVPVPDAEDEP